MMFSERSSILKFRQFHSLQFASVYSAVDEYQHCSDSICDGLLGSSVPSRNCTLS